VFPRRFETASQVVAAISGLIAMKLPDDELDRYRPAVAAVTADEVLAAASHVRADDASIVLVGDATRIEAGLQAAFGMVDVVHDPALSGPGGVAEPDDGPGQD
jgi:predicted Zn-dependent peptidase